MYLYVLDTCPVTRRKSSDFPKRFDGMYEKENNLKPTLFNDNGIILYGIQRAPRKSDTYGEYIYIIYMYNNVYIRI